MSTLTDTDFAAISTEDRIYLYYQQEKTILEVHSSDGVKWVPGISLAVDQLDPNGSPITAYFVKNDGSHDDKPTIHVFYIDSHGKLCEQNRVVSDSKWQAGNLPTEIATAPVNTSKLSSGVCHDEEQDQSHQWVYFTQENKDKGIYEVAEIRSGSPRWEWVYRKVLPDKGQAALPGTTIAANITDAVNYLFFQDHAGNIMQYSGGLEKWESGEVLIKSGNAVINTPLASCLSVEPGKIHMFYAANTATAGFSVQDFADQKNIRVTSWAPGSRLGAAKLSNTVYLFYKDATLPLAISTMLYKDGAWSRGPKVVG
ncbi:hypothetical protein NLG97_g7220 [Lecanicillium saksenae]|uniref:Uncharacterized protein n=1 Tax=Lecanicillium saksenae TaxID=468837 RepID=A0ACC1QNQ5_9HYPO|nr:hypothetical protein NLG97_g7220 [Lecanicillium saksenae]